MPTATPSSFPASAVHKALELRRALEQHKQRNPGGRARDIAASLGVSEGELAACHCGETALRLRPDWPALLGALEPVGTVMALTRNEHAVIESVGRYDGLSLQGHMGVVHGGTIDLRLFIAGGSPGLDCHQVLQSRQRLRSSAAASADRSGWPFKSRYACTG